MTTLAEAVEVVLQKIGLGTLYFGRVTLSASYVGESPTTRGVRSVDILDHSIINGALHTVSWGGRP
eukprot:5577132-Ditylum_brightwellii.AAC.1